MLPQSYIYRRDSNETAVHAEAIIANQEGGAILLFAPCITMGGERAAIDTARACRLFYPATSLGGVESLIEHGKTVSSPGFDVHPNLLRLSIWIEDAQGLIDDLEQALARAAQ